MPALNEIRQTDWSGGIWRESEPQTAPKNSMYDCQDGLLDDTLSVYRRGGSAYKSNANTTGTLRGVTDVILGNAAINTTLFWDPTDIYKLDTDDATPVALGLPGASLTAPAIAARGAVLGGAWCIIGGTSVLRYTGAGVPGTIAGAPATPTFITAVGTPGRLVVTQGNTAHFTPNGALTFAATDYHELPQGALIIGCEGLGDRLVLFTTIGVFVVSNMNYDLTDDFGNVQQSISHVDPNLVLWGNGGIADWRGALVVPAVDDVMLFSPGSASKVISESIRPLYRSYVAAGYSPGLGTVHNGHYFLPILNGTTWVDTLVCRLDRSAWTRWTGSHIGFAQRIGSTTRAPKLFAASGQRVLNLTGCFTPSASNKSEANGTTHNLSVTTRDYAGHPQLTTFCKKIRLRHETVDAATDNPTVTVDYSVGEVGTAFSSLGAAAPESAGTAPAMWPVGKRTQAIRFRVKSSGPCASCTFRSLDVFMRPSGKQ